MKKAVKVLLGIGAVGAAASAAFLAIRHHNMNKGEFIEDEDFDEDDYEEDEDDDELYDLDDIDLDDFDDPFSDDEEKAEVSPYEPEIMITGDEMPKQFIFANHLEYLDFATFTLRKKSDEIMQRLGRMYTLISRRNIKAEEKEKMLKDLVTGSLDDCRSIKVSADGIEGVIHDGYSKDFDMYFILKGEAEDQLRAEAAGNDEE